MSDGARPIAVLTEESERQLDVLRRGMRRAGSFSLFVVLAGDAARFEVLRRLRAWSGLEGIPELYFFPEGEEAATAVERFLATENRDRPLMGAVIPDGNVLLDTGDGAAIAALNLARDNLGKLIRGPLVLVVSPHRAADLARAAPDLFDVRRATVEVESVPVELVSEPAFRSPETVALSLDSASEEPRSRAELQAEAAQLRALAASSEPPQAGALADAWLRIGFAFQRLGEQGEARAAAEEARRHAERIGYTRGVADALVLEAGILGPAGHIRAWEQALRRALALHHDVGDLSREANDLSLLGEGLVRISRLDEAEVLEREALQIFDKLGDVRSRAVVLGTIADILQKRGHLDEALRIRSDEQLPVFEKLGELRERAVTLGRIANIHEARGQLDEALRIQTDEALPVYEKLALARDLLIGRTNLAFTYLKRGQPGDREKAAKLLHLALAAAESLHLPDADTIRRILRDHNLGDT